MPPAVGDVAPQPQVFLGQIKTVLKRFLKSDRLNYAISSCEVKS